MAVVGGLDGPTLAGGGGRAHRHGERALDPLGAGALAVELDVRLALVGPRALLTRDRGDRVRDDVDLLALARLEARGEHTRGAERLDGARAAEPGRVVGVKDVARRVLHVEHPGARVRHLRRVAGAADLDGGAGVVFDLLRRIRERRDASGAAERDPAVGGAVREGEGGIRLGVEVAVARHEVVHHLLVGVHRRGLRARAVGVRGVPRELRRLAPLLVEIDVPVVAAADVPREDRAVLVRHPNVSGIRRADPRLGHLPLGDRETTNDLWCHHAVGAEVLSLIFRLRIHPTRGGWRVLRFGVSEFVRAEPDTGALLRLKAARQRRGRREDEREHGGGALDEWLWPHAAASYSRWYMY